MRVRRCLGRGKIFSIYVGIFVVLAGGDRVRIWDEVIVWILVRKIF